MGKGRISLFLPVVLSICISKNEDRLHAGRAKQICFCFSVGSIFVTYELLILNRYEISPAFEPMGNRLCALRALDGL